MKRLIGILAALAALSLIALARQTPDAKAALTEAYKFRAQLSTEM